MFTRADVQEALYRMGYAKPNYPVPAIPLEVHWQDTGYRGMVYIDDNSYPDDPIMVWFYDGWRVDRQMAL
jgi:hypothetical protein